VSTFDDFRELLKGVDTAEDACYGPANVEESYVRVLEFMRSHPSEKTEFVRFFIDDIRRGGAYYILLMFCMRDLQWPEVRNELLQIRDSAQNPSVSYRMIPSILEAYEEKWPRGERIFGYYSRRATGNDKEA
jgi:hypothetical protein